MVDRRMTSMLAVATVATLAVVGCKTADHVAQDRQLTPELATQIETICGLPAGALTNGGIVPDAIAKLSCAVQEARKHDVTIGFISNPVDPDN